uniref:Cytochrome P450 monooxygenase n=1 Tax=Rhizobium meliloti TaxID=382 RepID=I2E1L3_RHIML|nr:cytochrome P450 monooxygenase [Sinorhizobium meliloti]
MRLFLASDVEAFRVVKMARIERRRRQSNKHLALRGNMHARDGHVGLWIPHDAAQPAPGGYMRRISSTAVSPQMDRRPGVRAVADGGTWTVGRIRSA